MRTHLQQTIGNARLAGRSDWRISWREPRLSSRRKWMRPLVRTDVVAQLDFLRTLLGAELVQELDAETGRAVMRLAVAVSTLRERSRLDVPLLVPRR